MRMNNVKRRGVIYKLENRINGKIYVGQTINESRRLNEHIKSKNRDYMPIDAAIFKYGYENFIYSILWEKVDDAKRLKKELNDKEIFYIRHFNSRTPNGYNVLNGGHSVSGCDNPMYGKPISDIHRQRLVASHRGKTNPMKGKHYPIKQKNAIVKKWKKAMAKKYDNGYVVKRKPITMYKIIGDDIECIGNFPNAKEIERQFSINYKRIHYVLKKEVPLDDTFIFIYSNEDQSKPFNLLRKKSANKQTKKFVKQIDNDGTTIKILSLTEATRIFGKHVSECCYGKRKRCNGYMFEWAINYNTK